MSSQLSDVNGIKGDWNWRRAVADSELASTTKHVLLTLSLYVSDAGEGVFPSLSTLVRQTSLTRKTVQVHLKTAVESGWIAKEERHADNGRQQSNSYRLAQPDLEGVAITPPSVANGRGEGVANNPPITLKGSRKKETPISPNGQTELLPTANGNGKAPTNGNGYTPGFLELWGIHRQGGKPAALKAYLKAVPAKIGHEDAREFLERYRDSLNEGFRGANLSTWLNQEYWEQDGGETRGNGRPDYGRIRG